MALRDFFRISNKPVLLTRRNIWIFFRYVVFYALVIHLSLGTLAYIRNHRGNGAQYAAVLISGEAFTKYDHWLSPVAMFGAYPYWTSYFYNRGLKTRWYVSAKSTDLEKVIRDENCVSIVLVGHGSFSLWAATDKDITPDEIAQMMVGQKKKTGEWLQLTCGVDEGLPKIGEFVMDKSRVYTYAESINAYYLVADALFGFKYIKSLSHGDKGR